MIDTYDKYSWTVLSYCLCIFFILAFGAYGLIWAKFRQAAELAEVAPSTLHPCCCGRIRLLERVDIDAMALCRHV